MKEILEKLGFKYLTGNLWQHKKTNIIISDHDLTIDNLVETLVNLGANEQNALIRATLGIKD